MKRRPILIIIAILTILGFLAPVTSQAQERTGPVPVAASLCPPFVIGEADKLDGLAILSDVSANGPVQGNLIREDFWFIVTFME